MLNQKIFMKNTRRDVLKSLSLTGLFSSLGLPFSVSAQPKEHKNNTSSTGAEDRLYWANLLYKMTYPVIHNLAEGTLKKNMPLETPPNYFLKVEKVTYMEAIGRTLAGVAPWLALPDDDTQEGALRKQLKADLLRGLPRCVDPSSSDYLNFRFDIDFFQHLRHKRSLSALEFLN